LVRILRHQILKKWNPVLLCSPGGWLVTECRTHGIPVIEMSFPGSRSLPARLFGNAAFARRVVRALEARAIRPRIVQANDHTEGLLGLAIARRLDARSAVFLRSAAMTRDDYDKYRCGDYDFVATVSGNFRDRMLSWAPEQDVAVVPDGIYADEIEPPRPKAPLPRRVLVVGSPAGLKGWADLAEALARLEADGVLPAMQFDFAGSAPDPAQNDLRLERLKTVRCQFLGRVEAFRDLVLGYDLVINPSRMETFGMAAIEVLAAGVPLLSSRTGVIEQVLEQPDVLFPPMQPDRLAAVLKNVLQNWTDIDFGVARAQDNIRSKFLIDHTASKLNDAYEMLSVVGVSKSMSPVR
jgi:glycosyltransferase involved in cell wall biosynthesis